MEFASPVRLKNSILILEGFIKATRILCYKNGFLPAQSMMSVYFITRHIFLRPLFYRKNCETFRNPWARVQPVSVSLPNMKWSDGRISLLSELQWVGVADVEFMIDPRDGTPKLMEINPRFWSSLYLAIKCGVDFPFLLAQTAFNQGVQTVVHYKEGVAGRSLFPNDLFHYLMSPDRKALTRTFWADLGQDELISREDPLPFLGFVLSAIQHSVRPSTWRFLIRR